MHFHLASLLSERTDTMWEASQFSLPLGHLARLQFLYVCIAEHVCVCTWVCANWLGGQRNTCSLESEQQIKYFLFMHLLDSNISLPFKHLVIVLLSITMSTQRTICYLMLILITCISQKTQIWSKVRKLGVKHWLNTNDTTSMISKCASKQISFKKEPVHPIYKKTFFSLAVVVESWELLLDWNFIFINVSSEIRHLICCMELIQIPEQSCKALQVNLTLPHETYWKFY